ncbi:hypothetical protein BJY00DRAFT_150913 [Aspergillus carlsbadensis]|nr:hypothetical protein BJY00DRAFT_150913 [Aspergillus carlsbadensis]
MIDRLANNLSRGNRGRRGVLSCVANAAKRQDPNFIRARDTGISSQETFGSLTVRNGVAVLDIHLFGTRNRMNAAGTAERFNLHLCISPHRILCLHCRLRISSTPMETKLSLKNANPDKLKANIREMSSFEYSVKTTASNDTIRNLLAGPAVRESSLRWSEEQNFPMHQISVAAITLVDKRWVSEHTSMEDSHMDSRVALPVKWRLEYSVTSHRIRALQNG